MYKKKYILIIIIIVGTLFGYFFRFFNFNLVPNYGITTLFIIPFSAPFFFWAIYLIWKLVKIKIFEIKYVHYVIYYLFILYIFLFGIMVDRGGWF